ncbi:MAG: hypothetical protein HXY38_13145 [Chloroflexi bacterium]|nr:hypothetical protein [Chloroflexota bacterium]
MPASHKVILCLSIASLLLFSCSTTGATVSPEPSLPAPVTDTPPPTSTPEPASPPETTATPIPEQPANGAVIHDDGKTVSAIDPVSGEKTLLISHDELARILPPDRSAESYTFGYERPIAIDLSPDLTKALLAICSSLDARLRCVFEYFIYSLESKDVTRLPAPADTYGIYWQWSSDSAALAGAGWTYDAAAYQITRFYSVRADGAGLQTLDAVNNGRWRIAWHPGGRVILPMTFITNFESIFVDGSGKEEISIPELAWNDAMECLSFSPDNSKVAFVIRRELPKDHDWVYVARSDFVNPTLLTEYDIDARYDCSMAWSRDQTFVSVKYLHEPGPETGQERSAGLVPLGKVVRIETGSLIELPRDVRICAWAPDGNLIYEKAGFAGAPGGIEAFSPAASRVVSLPEALQNAVKTCPHAWLSEKPAFEIPEGIPLDNACHPGETYSDEINPTVSDVSSVLFDILEATSRLDGETLEVVMKFDAAIEDLAAYTTPGITKVFNGWEALVDVDNNTLTCDTLGVEYRLSVVVRPASGGNPAAFGSAILKFDPVAGSYVRADMLAIKFDPQAKTIGMLGKIPGITTNSRLVFLSRLATGTDANPNITGDRICD